MVELLLVTLVASMTGSPVVGWEFGDSVEGWTPNPEIEGFTHDNGGLTGQAIGGDAFILNQNVDFPASAAQAVEVRIRADRSGMGQVYWSEALEGRYGGLTPDQQTSFQVRGTGEWETITVFPFWHTVDRIRQLRVNVPAYSEFAIDSIRIVSWTDEDPTSATAWGAADLDLWRVDPEGRKHIMLVDRLDADALHWVTVQIQSDSEGLASVVWANDDAFGLHREQFPIVPSDESRTYIVEMAGLPDWESSIMALGVELPLEGVVHFESLEVATEPVAPPQLELSYFDFENYPNRAGMPCSLLVRVTNHGGQTGAIENTRLILSEGLTMTAGPEPETVSIPFGDFADWTWELQADRPGDYPIAVEFDGPHGPERAERTLTFSEPLGLPGADYVPEPQPIETAIDIAAYYFPGWDAAAKWEPIRTTTPERKPVLGYYDEADPEVVEWQIKWAVENGISIFLVDWYWTDGARMLEHWFEAYREARYRDYLDVAIMWANHNPPDTHSREDWIAVTQHWIDEYFHLDTYVHIDGKPAVFIWDARNIRADLGGSEAVRAAFHGSQQMAQDAGYEGITYIALHGHESRNLVEQVAYEGYAGTTTYHEWGDVTGASTVYRRGDFEDVVQTAPAHWAEKRERSQPLTYYPVATTGWDSRPWHGHDSLVIRGRTPERFERLLRKAKAFCGEHNKDMLVIGPVNEWGEGSYIEPCTEYGFEMYEAIRRVFAIDITEAWPQNVAPVDVALGPYDLPPVELRTHWTFDDSDQGWTPMMGISDFHHENGAIHMRTTTHDPALTILIPTKRADAFDGFEVQMRLDGADVGVGQLFWALGGASISEATSVRFPIEADGALHTYRVDLSDHPRWRGRITGLRFDPCEGKDVNVTIESFRFFPAEP